MIKALYLIPVTLGDTPIEQVLPAVNREIIMGIRHFIVENVRTARRFLKQVEPSINIDALTFYELNQHTDRTRLDEMLRPLQHDNQPMGIISEAGCPAVADPGADVVAIAQRKGLRVVPLVGPSSILLSVMASGFNGQSFAFCGYLPIDEGQRQARLRLLEQRSKTEDQTQIFIETPYRNLKLMQTLLSSLKPQTRICLAVGITTADENIRTRSVQEWRQLMDKAGTDEARQRIVPKVPSIFLIYYK